MDNEITKIVTATILRDGDYITYSEYMSNQDISAHSTALRRYREIYGDGSCQIDKLSIEIVSRNRLTGNETVLTRFYI